MMAPTTEVGCASQGRCSSAGSPVRLREDAGLNLEEEAAQLDWSTGKLGRIETADVPDQLSEPLP